MAIDPNQSEIGSFSPQIARRSPTIPSPHPQSGSAIRSGSSEGTKLVVGRDIVLSGEIAACGTLVVEGRVEATLNDSKRIEVGPQGVFKGDVEIDEADVAGRFEGRLKVRGTLKIRAGGVVEGSIQYGSIEIEAGGRIIGDIQFVEGTANTTSVAPPRPVMSESPNGASAENLSD